MSPFIKVLWTSTAILSSLLTFGQNTSFATVDLADEIGKVNLEDTHSEAATNFPREFTIDGMTIRLIETQIDFEAHIEPIEDEEFAPPPEDSPLGFWGLFNEQGTCIGYESYGQIYQLYVFNHITSTLENLTVTEAIRKMDEGQKGNGYGTLMHKAIYQTVFAPLLGKAVITPRYSRVFDNDTQTCNRVYATAETSKPLQAVVAYSESLERNYPSFSSSIKAGFGLVDIRKASLQPLGAYVMSPALPEYCLPNTITERFREISKVLDFDKDKKGSAYQDLLELLPDLTQSPITFLTVIEYLHINGYLNKTRTDWVKAKVEPKTLEKILSLTSHENAKDIQHWTHVSNVPLIERLNSQE